MASIRDTLAGLFAKESPSAIQGTPLGKAYPNLAQPEPGLEAPFLSPDDLIGTGIGKAALVGAGKAMPLIAGTFIGPKSKLWNTEAHALAKALEEKGLSQQEIWSQTFKEHGVPTARTHNESWAQEIPSNTAKISGTTETLKTGGYKAQPVKDVSYIKRGNNYDVTLSPYNPERTSDFVQLRNLDKHLLESALPEDIAGKILKGESHQPTYMGALEDASQLNTPFDFGGMNALPANYAYEHPQLFEHYPHLKDTMVQVDPKAYNSGSFSITDKGNIIKIGTGKQKDIMEHEMQHAVDTFEGLPSGASPEDFPNAIDLSHAKFIREKIDSGLNPSEAFNYVKNKLGVEPSLRAKGLGAGRQDLGVYLGEPVHDYMRSAGEVQARAAERRLPLTMEERAANFPFQYEPKYGYDVDPEKLIFQNGPYDSYKTKSQLIELLKNK
jgi:hypothetical protein